MAICPSVDLVMYSCHVLYILMPVNDGLSVPDQYNGHIITITVYKFKLGSLRVSHVPTVMYIINHNSHLPLEFPTTNT
jgi:hypothetical protein